MTELVKGQKVWVEALVYRAEPDGDRDIYITMANSGQAAQRTYQGYPVHIDSVFITPPMHEEDRAVVELAKGLRAEGFCLDEPDSIAGDLHELQVLIDQAIEADEARKPKPKTAFDVLCDAGALDCNAGGYVSALKANPDALRALLAEAENG